MIDFTGKVPDGIASDFISIQGIKIPFGNTVVFGDFHGCLSIDAQDASGTHIKGGYTLVGPTAKNAELVVPNGFTSSNYSFKPTGDFDNLGDFTPSADQLAKLLALINFIFGICAPASCSGDDIANGLNVVVNKVKIGDIMLAMTAGQSQNSETILYDFDTPSILFMYYSHQN